MTATDVELVTRAKAGDETAFACLFGRYNLLAHWLAIKFVHNHEDAQDIAQEAFIRVHRYLHNFKGESGFRTWLYTIVRNLSHDRLRKRGVAKREAKIPADAFVDPGTICHHDPLRHLGRKELRSQITDAIDGLSGTHRDVVILRELEGLSYMEVAEAMGCTIGAARSRLHHARLSLREHLAELVGAEEGSKTDQT